MNGTFSDQSGSLADGSAQQNDARYSNDSGEPGERGTSSGGGVGSSGVTASSSTSGFDRLPPSVGSGNADNGGGSSDLVNCKDGESRQQQQQQQSSSTQQGGSSTANFDPGPACPEANVCRRRGRPPSTSLVPTDLRIKMEPIHATGLRGDELSAATYKELKQHVAAAAAAAAAAGNDKEIAASLWTAASKQVGAHKGSSLATPDGHSCAMPILLPHLHTEQHGKKAHCSRAQDRAEHEDSGSCGVCSSGCCSSVVLFPVAEPQPVVSGLSSPPDPWLCLLST
ncbi:hypothetical protein B566_EDAN014844 [Ephemera danica]|nr:hypothetical protein B566_EDAN014844 [Ephemera danica]